MIQALKREWMEGVRTYRFLIILVAFLFFAMLNPMMNKLVLPEILKSQFQGMSDDMLQTMVVSSQRDCVRGYLSDVFEITTLVLVLTLSTLVAAEVKNRTFIFPLCSKKQFATLVASKLLLYGVVITFAATLSVLVDYFYAGIFFGTDLPAIWPVVRAGLLQGLYYLFVVSLVLLCGSLTGKPLTAGLLALIPAYGTHLVSQLFKVQDYTPAGLIHEGQMLAVNTGSGIYVPIVVTLSLVVVMILLTIMRLQSLELARRS